MQALLAACMSMQALLAVVLLGATQGCAFLSMPSVTAGRASFHKRVAPFLPYATFAITRCNSKQAAADQHSRHDSEWYLTQVCGAGGGGMLACAPEFCHALRMPHTT